MCWKRCEIRRCSKLNFYGSFFAIKPPHLVLRLALKLMANESFAVGRMGELWISSGGVVLSSHFLILSNLGLSSPYFLFRLREKQIIESDIKLGKFNHPIRCWANDFCAREWKRFRASFFARDFPREHFTRNLEFTLSWLINSYSCHEIDENKNVVQIHTMLRRITLEP